MLGLAWYAGSDPTSTLPIFLLVIGYGTARAFAFPASRALPADTVPASAAALVGRAAVDQLAGGVDPRAGPGWLPLRRRRAAPVPGCRRSARGRCRCDLARATHLSPRAGAGGLRSRRDRARRARSRRARGRCRRDAHAPRGPPRSDGGPAVRAQRAGTARRDLARPRRGAVRRRGRAAARHRRGPTRRGCGGSRVAARRRRYRRGARHAPARVQAGHAAGGFDDVDRGRDLRASAPSSSVSPRATSSRSRRWPCCRVRTR